MEGIVVGIVGSEGMFGNGGKVTFGRLRHGGEARKWRQCRDGWVVGRVGMVGKGGTDGSGGNWRSWRAATATLLPEKTNAKEKATMKNLKEAMDVYVRALNEENKICDGFI
uniref:Uncharacterized protein n=1 Tax=Salix viminalis TaxID=40686 RepID=A0A6N2M3J6_SALVM